MTGARTMAPADNAAAKISSGAASTRSTAVSISASGGRRRRNTVVIDGAGDCLRSFGGPSPTPLLLLASANCVARVVCC